MNGYFLTHILKGDNAVNAGPLAKELIIDQAEHEYGKNNFSQSIFYQVRALYQPFQERYYRLKKELRNASNTQESQAIINQWEHEDIENNPLMQYVINTVSKNQTKECKDSVTCNFLQNIVDPLEGIKKIEQVMQEMPKEWTIIQLCKGPRPETTYSIYPHIHEHDAAIYLTILKHARSTDYPTPITLRFCAPMQAQLFKKFSSIAFRFKQCVSIDIKQWVTKESKQFYWKILDTLNQYIAGAIDDLKDFFYPWNCLFTGSPNYAFKQNTSHEKHIFMKIDAFCDEYKWATNERVLFSLAALHVDSLNDLEKHAICMSLTNEKQLQDLAFKLLSKFKSEAATATGSSSAYRSKAKSKNNLNHYPCILVVDERLDHFFWEEINVMQEFCRVTSLQCLWYLFQLHKAQIRSGYLAVDINDGGCIVNPDNNLPKTEFRMKNFFQYWTPHWEMKFQQKPTQDELLNVFFKRSCYVYCGHGSGLQYINGKHIAKEKLNCVVFLFGCDSTRLHSNGLYSELIGPHLYYQAGACPTLVGTLMPGLDANMDNVSTDILSRWIAPKSKSVLPWNEIDHTSWVKEGVVKPKKNVTEPTTMAETSNYHMGSLCAVLARVHQRLNEAKLYNTVPYVCRGLPVWNCAVEALPI